MSNYPPGAENDPRAPWNQKDPVYEECEQCEGTGFITDSHEMCDVECDECDGEGKIEVEDDE